MKIIKRNGAEAVFDIEKIKRAISKANDVAEERERMTPLQIERIAQSDLEELILLDTIPYPQGKPAVDKIHYLSVANVFAEAIERIYEDLSLASMFE